ncbi:hypothetical protein [Saccharospirillum salsuginis]|uniref:Uncharacterized protein n=1 Tax=Saccharospirillum salsuginis TaxID=418750 RepID=A0A918JZS9_9GAMM|nr:hypothetical protein [Saccharospirillum salsuginis]GGX39721.1 hypothetical protein GCM10007392_02790 [Saccharospirillum salsuginis]
MRVTILSLLVTLVAIANVSSSPIPEYMKLNVDHNDGDNYLYLGYGYNTLKSLGKGYLCLDGKKELGGNVVQKVFSTYNLTHEEASNIYNGNASVGVENPLISIGAGSDWAHSISSNSISQSINMTVTYIPKKEVYRPADARVGSFSLTDQCQTILDSHPENYVEAFGDQFVTAIEYAANLSVTLTLTSTSRSDRELLSGALKFTKTGVSFEGELSDLSEQLSSATRVSVNVRQKGGDPSQLIKFGASSTGNLSDCTTATANNAFELGKCLSLFEDATEYAQTDFRSQLALLSDYAVSGYEISRYSTSGIPKLEQPQNSELSNLYREYIMTDVSQEYGKSKADHRVAQYLRTNGRIEDQDVLENIVYITQNNYSLAEEILEYCKNNPYGSKCADYYMSNKSDLIAYDDSVLNSY